MIRLLPCVLAVSIVPMFARAPRPAVVNAVTDHYRPLAFDQQKLAGVLSERMRAAREGYLERVSDKVLFAAFQNPSAQPGEGAAAEVQAGEFVNAAAGAYEYSHDPNLKAVMDRVTRKLLSIQSANGYLGTYAKNKAWQDSDIVIHESGLRGFLAYYRVTGDEDTFAASRKIADLLLTTFNKQESRSPKLTTLIEPLVSLYRYTDDSRYLEYARSLADVWLHSTSAPLDATCENLSVLTGLLELYRVTGDSSYFRPVVTSWNEIRSDRLTITGGPVTDSAGPTICATTAWVQLTLDLLRITGDSLYGDQLERTIYNQLFAAEDPKTGSVFASTAPNGSKKLASETDPGTPMEAEGLSVIPAVVWGRYGRGIAIILYTPGRATFQLRRRGTIQLYSEASYPETGEILLHVEPSHDLQFPLRLRVPEWTSKFVVDIGGSHLLGKPGEFITINRQWKRGDTVKIGLDMTVHMLNGTRESADRLAIARGPQILVLDKTVNPGINELAGASLSSTDASQLKTPPVESRFPANWAGSQAYTLSGEYNSQPHQFVLIPFADALNYSLWIGRPGVHSGGRDQ